MILNMNKYLESCHHKEFSWGRWDCCIFVSDYILQEYGFDPMSEYRGKYSSYEDALALIKGKNLSGAIKDSLGKPSKVAGYGKIAYGCFEDGPSLGICIGPISVFLGEKGLTKMQNRDCIFFEVNHG